MNETLTTEDRLKNISHDAKQLIALSPIGNVSKLRGFAEQIDRSAVKLTRVLQAAPNSIPAVRAARFSSSAETVLDGIRTLCALYGHDADASMISHESEAEMAAVVSGLGAFAEQARQEAISTVRQNLQTSAEVVAAWNMPLAVSSSESALIAKDTAYDGTLSSVFLKGSHSNAGASQPVVPKLGFMSRLVRKKLPTASEGKEQVKVSAALVNEVMSAMGGQQRDGNKVYGRNFPKFKGEKESPVAVWISSDMDEWGLSVTSYKHHAYVHLTYEPPKVMTEAWRAVAKDVCGDPDSLHRALVFKDDPSFRDTLNTTLISGLSRMEKQIAAGIPMPQIVIKDPVMKAAITMTLTAMGQRRLLGTTSKELTDTADPFGIRKGLEMVMSENPGLDVQPRTGGIALLTQKSIITPTGIVAQLEDNIRAYREIIRDFECGKQMVVVMSEHAVELMDHSFMEMVANFCIVHVNFSHRNIQKFLKGGFQAGEVGHDGYQAFTYIPSDIPGDEWGHHYGDEDEDDYDYVPDLGEM